MDFGTFSIPSLSPPSKSSSGTTLGAVGKELNTSVQGHLIGVIRDSNGNVKFDDFTDIPKDVWCLLDEKDWTYIHLKASEQRSCQD